MAKDKNFLGLGVVFKGIDQGFSKTVDAVSKGANKASKSLGGLKNAISEQVKIKKTSFDIKKSDLKFRENRPFDFKTEDDLLLPSVRAKKQAESVIPKDNVQQTDVPENNPSKFMKGIHNILNFKDAIAQLSGSIKNTVNILPDLSQALVGTGKVSELSKSLDKMKIKMGLVFSKENANTFVNATKQMMQNYGVTTEEAVKITTTMNNWGFSIKKSTGLMDKMGQLVGVMGMDAGETANMFGQMTNQLGFSIKETNTMTEQFYELGRRNGFTDFIQEMPNIIGSVTEQFNKMGIINKQVAKGAVASTAALAASYTKLGFSQKQAVEAAKKVQETGSSMMEDIKRMQVGLDPKNFDGLIDVAAEMSRVTGKTTEEIFNELQNAATNPKLFQENMQKIAAGLSEQDLFRFSEMMKPFGDEFSKVLRNPELRKQAENILPTEKMANPQKAKKSMDEAVEDQKNSFEVKERTLALNKELIKAESELAAKNAIISSWNTQMDKLRSIQESIIKQDFTGKTMAMAAAMEAGGIAAAAYFAGYDAAGKNLADIGTTLKVVYDLLQKIGIIFGAVGILWNFGAGIISIGKAFVGLAETVGGAMKGLGAIGAKLGSLFGPATALALAGGLGWAIGEAFNKLTEGTIVDKKLNEFAGWLGKKWGELDLFGSQPKYTIDKSKMVAPSSINKTKIENVSPSIPAQGKVLENQPQASVAANGYVSQFKMKEKNNTLDDVVKAVVDMKDSLQSKLDQLAQRPLMVALQGDAKRFFSVVNNEASDRVSTMGMANAVGG